MQRIGKFENFKVDGIVGMDVPERYRNKMVFPVGNVYGKNVCGFYAMRSHDIIPLDDCSLGDEINKEINDAVIDYMNEKIKKLTGVDTRITRFPGGSSNTVSRFNPGIMTKLTKEVINHG